MRLRHIILCFLMMVFIATVQGQTVPGSSIVSRTYLSADSTRLMEQRVYDNGLGDMAQNIDSSQTSHIQGMCRSDYYSKAYSEITDMLEGRSPLSIRRSVFMAEWAYLDGNLDYEHEFCEPIKKGADYLRRMIAVNHYERYKTAKQIALCNFFFYPCSGNGQNPFQYDFSKEYPEDDWHYQLVSRTIRTHHGQCHSLPWTFKLYAEELGAEVYLSHAPRHCFIIYKDEDDLFPEDWVNVEVTAKQYQPTWGIKEHFAITDSAIAVGTYLTPITDVQTVACQLADLALGYYHKYKRYDEFTLRCASTSLKYYAMNPNAIMTKAKSLDALLRQHLEQNGNFKDAYTEWNDAQFRQCMANLKATHWTQETEELRNKWEQTPEQIENIRKNIQTKK